MKGSALGIASLCLVALACRPRAPAVGLPPPPPKWLASPVVIWFNPDLDPLLDTANNPLRVKAFTDAADDWNAAFQLLNIQVRIAVKGVPAAPANGAFAADWAQPRCLPVSDFPLAPAVYDRDFFLPDHHFPNRVNTASFGHRVPNLGPQPGPGWTSHDDKPGGSQISMELLAETMPRINPPTATTPPAIVEADIVFHTHFYEANPAPRCPKIPWGFPAGATDYDFKSVALHELGHALGLDHLGPDAKDNVMRPLISTGEILVIGPLELGELKRMY